MRNIKLFQTQRRWATTHHFVHEVLKDKGYPADIFDHSPTLLKLTPHEAFAVHTASLGKNIFVTGMARSGKTAILRHIGQERANVGKKVAYCGATNHSAVRMHGIVLNSFLGVKQFNAKVRREQLEGMLDRHVRHMSEKMANVLPTLVDIDVLLIDDIQHVPLVVLEALDVVARRTRGNPKEIFGGLQIISAGNFFDVVVTHDEGNNGYAFQKPLWNEAFPPDQQVALVNDDDAYSKLVVKAYFGTLDDSDVLDLEAMSLMPPKDNPFPIASFLDTKRGSFYRYCHFPKYRCNYHTHKRIKAFRGTELGHFLAETAMRLTHVQSYGMRQRIQLTIGEPVQFVYGNGTTIKMGDIGVVHAVHDEAVEIRFLRTGHIEAVFEMRTTCYHPDYPDAAQGFSQFPFVPRASTCLTSLLQMQTPCKYVELDARWILEINGLGPVLAHLDRPSFVPNSMTEYIHRDNNVHEATKIAFEGLFNIVYPDSLRYCKNCKVTVPSEDFDTKHWNACVEATRWCAHCDVSVPLQLWDSHSERHTMVRCFDCGKILQWRSWDSHRQSCPGMLKELSPDNPYIPAATRSLSLALGHDRKDLHGSVPLNL